MYFPPAGGGGVQRPLKFATHLPELGIETHVLAPDDPKWIHRDDELAPPTLAWVHRARYVGPKGRKPAEELHGTRGLERATRHARLAGRRLLVPDENVSWNLTAIPAAIRIARAEGIDVVITTSPPSSVHLVGAAVKRAARIPWVADLRDSLVAHPHRRAESALVRAKESGEHAVARLVTRRADAIVCVSEAIVDEIREREPRGTVDHISNGADFDDFAGLEYARGARFRITHTGSFFGKRDPAPVPARAGARRRRRRPLRRRLPERRPRVGRGARARRPPRADRLPAAPPRARAPARLGGAPAADPRGRRARQGRPVREGLRVPRRRAADPRGRPARRRGRGAPARDRRRRRRRARRRRRDRARARGAPRRVARGRARRAPALRRVAAEAVAPDARRGARARARGPRALTVEP